MKNKKISGRECLRISLADVHEINSAFLDEMERVKARLNTIKDAKIIEAFHGVILGAYNTAIDLRVLEREVDYDVKYAEINERRRALKPWRRCWLWRLLFQATTNRAQDIIEARAEIEADNIHTAEEKAIEIGRKALKTEKSKKACDELEAVIKRADNAETNEVFTEPPVQAERNEPQSVQEQPSERVRRPRPPTSCRRR